MIERICNEINEKEFCFCSLNYCVGYKGAEVNKRNLFVYNELYIFFKDMAYQITIMGKSHPCRTHIFNFPRAEENKVNGYNIHRLFEFRDPTDTCEHYNFYDSLEEFERLLVLEDVLDWTTMDWYKSYQDTLLTK